MRYSTLGSEAASATRLALIEASLELAADRIDDIVPLVYQRLFAMRQDLPAIFAVASDAAPRSGMGNMINEVLRLILADGKADTDVEAHSAVVFHLGWGLDLQMYSDVLDAVLAAVHGACGETWTTDMLCAWGARLEEVRAALARQSAAMGGVS